MLKSIDGDREKGTEDQKVTAPIEFYFFFTIFPLFSFSFARPSHALTVPKGDWSHFPSFVH